MNALRKALADYLELRRGVGYKLHRNETRLQQFLTFLSVRKTTRITNTLALQFATDDTRLTQKTMAMRLSAVRGFARYHAGNDPATEVPPFDLLPSKSRPARPYLYSQAELIRLLNGARNYPSWNRFRGPWWHRCQGWSWYCFFGLLVVTGMRVGEVRNLQSEDIDWKEGILTVRNAKFGKSRLVPLHRTMLQALATFVQHRDRFISQLRPQPMLKRLFVNSRGNGLHITDVNRVFLRVCRQIGLRAENARRGPRCHDLRHRFAIETLLHWYRRGEQVDRLLPVLSTYLGHAHVSGTYWYLRCTPELMAAAGDRLERRWKGIQ